VPSPIRFAVVGLGDITREAVLPAFARAKGSASLVALVSGSPRKRSRLGETFGAPLQVGYEHFGALMDSGDVDAVYIATPNQRHREFAVRAAQAGVHVLCEKPLAATLAEARAIHRAAERHDVRLMVAYRLHFDPATLHALEAARSEKMGALRLFSSVFASPVEAGDIRLEAVGRGALFDLGIYCVNAARMVFRSEPTEVMAMHAGQGEGRFREVPEMTSAMLRYPGDRMALFVCSLHATRTNWWSALGTAGMVRMEPAYHYDERLEVHVHGRRSKQRRVFPVVDQFAGELRYFVQCIRTGRVPEPSGREGVADVMILDAIDRSARTGRRVRLGTIPRDAAPSARQRQAVAPVRKR
jgi:glucose-fructose oxidoreductase